MILFIKYYHYLYFHTITYFFPLININLYIIKNIYINHI